MKTPLLFTSALLCLTAPATAQQQPPPPAARLQQMESIYQKELSTRHIPLLGRYLLELQRQAATVPAADKPAYEAEISRIQQIIHAGGALDLIATQQAQAGAMPMPAPMPTPVPEEQKQALIALSPALAQDVTPTPPPDAATATIGEIAWRIEFIAAGTYDILIHYSCPELKEPLRLRLEFNGQTLEKDLEADRSTKDESTFRILRLGSLTLTGDIRGETLRLSAGDKTAPQLILKGLLITRPRPPPPLPEAMRFAFTFFIAFLALGTLPSCKRIEAKLRRLAEQSGITPKPPPPEAKPEEPALTAEEQAIEKKLNDTAMQAAAVPAPEVPAAPAFELNKSSVVAILGYHDFRDRGGSPMLIAAPKFREQMQAIKDSKIPVISFSDMMAWKRGEKNIPEEAIVITMDDGWEGVYTYAFPSSRSLVFPSPSTSTKNTSAARAAP